MRESRAPLRSGADLVRNDADFGKRGVHAESLQSLPGKAEVLEVKGTAEQFDGKHSAMGVRMKMQACACRRQTLLSRLLTIGSRG